MKQYFIKTNILFIVPIAIWLAFYGALLINANAEFTKVWIKSLLLGAVPYIILWVVATRLPDKAKFCRVSSLPLFTVTALLGIKYLFFSHSSEEAIGFFILPFFIPSIILYIIPILLLAAMIIYIRRFRIFRPIA